MQGNRSTANTFRASTAMDLPCASTHTHTHTHTHTQRLLSIIKSLDDRCLELNGALAHHTACLLALPPRHEAAEQKQSASVAAEYDKLMHRVSVDHQLLAQFAEEKVRWSVVVV